MAYVNLHHGYRMPGQHPKFGVQRAGPYPVLRAVGTQAYELDLPEDWRIHLVISSEHLEAAPLEKDPFD